MIWRLFCNQLPFFWYLIRTRFLSWFILMNAVVILLSMQTAGNPHATIFSLFFDGVSFRAAETHRVVLPVLWFAYFFVPLLILLNGLQQLWHTRTIHLRGLQIPPRKFAEVNLMLIALITTIYEVGAIGIMAIAAAFNLHFGNWQGLAAVGGLFVTTWLGVFLLLLLQAIGNHFSPSLALIIPACLLIVNAYTAIRMNPLGYLMLTRINATNAWHPILVLLGVSSLATMGYLAVERHASLN